MTSHALDPATLPRRAEAALERLGDHPSLFFEGRWQTSGELAARARRAAAGFVALLFIHEMGHYIQLRREGVRPSGMVFIPFLGAAVGTRSLGGSALAEARVGLAGPILGSLATAALLPPITTLPPTMVKPPVQA